MTESFPNSEPLNRPLEAILREKIALSGPITFRDWMWHALYYPELGYYARVGSSPWGRRGDYRTSPERSELFPVTFARFFQRLYEEADRPQDFAIVEFGPGNGAFAERCIRAISLRSAEVFEALTYVVVGASEAELARVRSRVGAFNDKLRTVSSAGLSQLRFEQGIVFSNELVDALPVHRVVSRNDRMKELFVGLDDRQGFSWVELDPSTPELASYFDGLGIELEEGQFAEVNLDARDWLCASTEIVERGVVVTVDYGDTAASLYDRQTRPLGTLRTFHSHKIGDAVLDSVGETDITASVCWTALSQWGQRFGLRESALQRLDEFLLTEGILEELELVQATQDMTDRLNAAAGVKEMVLPGGMGTSFQVLVQRKG